MSDLPRMRPLTLREVDILRRNGFRLPEPFATDRTMPGAWPNGTRVVKAVQRSGDVHQIGAPATVRGCLGDFDGEFGYMVEWDDMPGKQVFIRGEALRLA